MTSNEPWNPSILDFDPLGTHGSFNAANQPFSDLNFDLIDARLQSHMPSAHSGLHHSSAPTSHNVEPHFESEERRLMLQATPHEVCHPDAGPDAFETHKSNPSNCILQQLCKSNIALFQPCIRATIDPSSVISHHKLHSNCSVHFLTKHWKLSEVLKVLQPLFCRARHTAPFDDAHQASDFRFHVFMF